MTASRPASRPADRPAEGRSWTWLVTAVLHLLALAPYGVSSLVVEGAGYAALLLLWAAFGGVAVIVHRRWGGLSAAVPGVAVLTWFAVLSALDAAGVANG